MSDPAILTHISQQLGEVKAGVERNTRETSRLFKKVDELEKTSAVATEIMGHVRESSKQVPGIRVDLDGISKRMDDWQPHIESVKTAKIKIGFFSATVGGSSAFIATYYDKIRHFLQGN